MTRTEARLADALHAAADCLVQAETLRPLTAPEAPSRQPRARRRGWRLRVLAPVGAAAGVVLAVAVAFGVASMGWTGTGTRQGHHGRPALAWTPSSVPRGPASPPRYYTVDESTTVINIRDTATGKVTAAVPIPVANHFQMQPEGAVAGPDGEFVAAFDQGAQGPESARQTRLYSFRVGPAGHVAGLSLVKGGVLNGLTVSGFTSSASLAISPDGSRLAVAAYSTYGRSTGKASTPEVPRIVVINMRTGAREMWQGGLQRPGFGLSIPNVSWAPGGRWLVFLASWCQTQSGDGFCVGGAAGLGQVRTLSVAGGGGPLTRGSALLAQSPSYPFIVAALLTPGGGSITMAVLPGPGPRFGSAPRMVLRIVQVPLTTVSRPVLLYRARLGNRAGVTISSDASGRYWLLAGRSNGWIDKGTLRLLPPQHGFAVVDAW